MKLDRRTLMQGAAAAGALWTLGCATTGSTGSTGSSGGGAATGQAPLAAGQGAPGKPLRILILGGTGFLGPQLVEVAQARGHTLTLFNRGKTRPGLFPNVEKRHGDRDPTKGEGLKELEQGEWDAVVDTSGYVPRIVGASAQLLAPRVGHYVFISSISVYGDTRTPPDESTPVATTPDPTVEEIRGDTYGALKALCEQAAEKALPGRTTVIRPGLIVGPDDPTDRFTYWPVRVARGGEVMAPGDGQDPVQVIDARDLAAFAIRLVEQKVYGTFNATGPEGGLPMKAFLEQVRQGTGGDARFTWVGTDFLEQQQVAPWSDMPVWVPRTGDTAGMGQTRVAKAIAAGLTFRPLTDTARDTLAWFKTLPPERQAKLRNGLAAERETKVLAAWREGPGKDAAASKPAP
jgi:2'-hydroxyisoflavone reductase